jgi:uncharacterized protein (DUF2249 family)
MRGAVREGIAERLPKELQLEPKILDVRDISRAKGEPFASIMAAVDALRPGEPLLLTAPFKPEPLLRLLDSKGFDHRASSGEDGNWQVLFTRRPQPDASVDARNPLTWPKPAVLVDLSATPTRSATDAVLEALDGMLDKQVLFALLREEPTDLPFRLLDDNHLCFGRWQDGTYRVLVLVRGGAETAG